MAKELAHFKNFAKLKDTSLEFNDITVLAGKPSTGKSYVMKFMYAYNETISSIISGSYKMHYALMDSAENEQLMLNFLKNTLFINSKIDITEINKLIKLINDDNYIEAFEYIKQNRDYIMNTLDGDYSDLLDSFLNILQKFSDRQEKSLHVAEEEKFHFIFRNILESIFISIDQISSNFTYSNNNIELIYDNNELKINKLKLNKYNENAIFVETPLIIEFEKFLPEERFKTPYHIDSLLQVLNRKNFTFTSDEISNFINEFKNSTKKVLNGNISKGTKGFSFESDNGKIYNIVNVSSGVKSIGLLQYLVTNKALKKGSILFWEEPEVHLHPQWQLKMIDLFVELMKAGVKIVFSTHSPYMADYLNAISQKRGFRDRVSFNVLEEKDGIVSNYILDDNNWNILQKELMDTFEDILWQYL